ncbi:MAG: carbohydrate deacetylase [Planctomycetaceae bacterium]
MIGQDVAGMGATSGPGDRLLIVNADDLGQTPGINRGIEEAHREGLVSSATLLANGAAFAEGVALAARCPRLGVGLHLNLVEGTPVAPLDRVGSLVDARGELWGKLRLARRWLTGAIEPEHVRAEFAAQVGRLRAAGIEPTHFDSHQHLHVLPGLRELLFRAAVDLGLSACRWPRESPWNNLWPPRPGGWVRCLVVRLAGGRGELVARRCGLRLPAQFGGLCQTGSLSADWVAGWLRGLRDPTAELMVHPGHVDDALIKSGTRLVQQRESELRAMCDPALPALLRELGFRLGHFGELPANAGSRV